ERLDRLWNQELDAIQEMRQCADRWLSEEAKQHPIVRKLATAPGLGPIGSAKIVAIVVTPNRFRTTRQFWSYCGLGIVTRSSSDWVRDGNRGLRREVNQTGASTAIATDAQGSVQDRRHGGRHADDRTPAPSSLSADARGRNQTEPRQADNRTPDRGGGPGDVETRRGVQTGKANGADEEDGVGAPDAREENRDDRRRRRRDAKTTVRGEASSCRLVVPTRRTDPGRSLCPLGAPQEAMAHEGPTRSLVSPSSGAHPCLTIAADAVALASSRMARRRRL